MRRSAWNATVVATAVVLALASVCPAAQAAEVNLTGKWSINTDGGGTYYLRPVDDEVWWVGESPDGGQTWTNVGHGHIKGDKLSVKWADSPRGSCKGSGAVTWEVIVKDGDVAEIKKTDQVGDNFGGDALEPLK